MLTRLINKLFPGLTRGHERLDEQDIDKAIDILIKETEEEGDALICCAYPRAREDAGEGDGKIILDL